MPSSLEGIYQKTKRNCWQRLTESFPKSAKMICAVTEKTFHICRNVTETYHVVEQLLKSVDSLCDFQKSKLYQHMNFSEQRSSFAEELKEKLVEGFRDQEAFGYMKGNTDWEKIIV